MKRPWAMLLIAGVAVGCRQAQPATNPFLRTTVPPPGTGAVAVPTDPYYSQPAGVPGSAPPPGVAPVVPAGPPPVAVPPPFSAPSDNRYAPPGGSFQYNQSSLERPGSGGNQARDQPTEALARLDGKLTKTSQEITSERNAVQEALELSREADPVSAASYQGSRPTAARVPRDAADDENDADAPASSVRMVGSRTVDRADDLADEATEPAPVLRVTADDDAKERP